MFNKIPGLNGKILKFKYEKTEFNLYVYEHTFIHFPRLNKAGIVYCVLISENFITDTSDHTKVDVGFGALYRTEDGEFFTDQDGAINETFSTLMPLIELYSRDVPYFVAELFATLASNIVDNHAQEWEKS